MEQSYVQMDNSIGYDLYSLVQRNYDGLIGVETASGYWGLSTFNIGNVICLFNDNSLDNDGYFADFTISMLFVPNVNTNNVVRLSDKTYITDREQTICDMVRYNRHEFHLYETVISAYDDPEVDIDKLEKMAENYGILERLHELYEEALQAEEDDNE